MSEIYGAAKPDTVPAIDCVGSVAAMVGALVANAVGDDDAVCTAPLYKGFAVSAGPVTLIGIIVEGASVVAMIILWA
jgi:hypothetical protein